MDTTPLVNFAPTGRLLALALVLACLPLAWWWWRTPRTSATQRLAALTAITLFLTFDLVVFGSFTRLTDSGLGCPDWPGCYGSAGPIGAAREIAAAEAAQPGGPVTQRKAWIEMIHRYLAMVVGALLVVMTAYAWRHRRRTTLSPWWPSAILVWVLVQGLFGKYTVTLKLYPAVVTAHLLGGVLLLGLLAWQRGLLVAGGLTRSASAQPGVRLLAMVALALLALQIALGGWVSTNYAVLACNGFPSCNGQWWPVMDVRNGFTVLRELGQRGDGQPIGVPALVAIHMVHRMFALAVVVAMGVLIWRLRPAGGRTQPAPGGQTLGSRHGLALAMLVCAQVATGVSNVVFGWPLAAAVLHAAGAALMVWVLVSLIQLLGPASNGGPT